MQSLCGPKKEKVKERVKFVIQIIITFIETILIFSKKINEMY